MPSQSQHQSITIGTQELARLSAVILSAADVDTHDLLDTLGETYAQSARRRITETKRAPDGTPWARWSPAYAATRGAQHSLLRGEGPLEEQLTHVVTGRDSVEVGSNVPYFLTHLFGDADRSIPARPSLDTDGGFADPSDREDLRDVIRAFLGEMV